MRRFFALDHWFSILLLLSASPALSQTIDWTVSGTNSFNLSNGQLSATANNVCTATPVTATFSLQSGSAAGTNFPSASASNRATVGFNLTGSPNTGARLILDFGVGNEVENLTFTVFDIDRANDSGSSWNDQMVFSPTFGGTPTGANFACSGASCSWASSGNTVTSTTNNTSFTSAFGQVQVTIPGPVDRVVMDYRGLGPGTNNQFAGWGPLAFDCSATPILGLGLEITEKSDGAAARITAERTEGVIALDLQAWSAATESFETFQTLGTLSGHSRIDHEVGIAEWAARSSAYRVVEVDTRGRRLTHGPWAAGDLPQPKILPRRGRRPAPVARLAPSRRAAVDRPRFAHTESAGLFAASAAERAAVSFRGRAVSSATENGRVYWYAERFTDLWNRGGVYRLTPGDGLEMNAHVLAPSAAEPQALAFQRLEVEDNLVPATAATSVNDRQDFWYWLGFLATSSRAIEQEFSFQLPDVPREEPVLELHVAGGAFQNSSGRYEMNVAVNGVDLGNIAWSGHGPRVRRLEVPEGVLGWSNKVRMTAVPIDGQNLTVFYLDRAAVDYLAAPVADNGQVRFTATSSKTLVYGLGGGPHVGVALPPDRPAEWLSAASLASSVTPTGLVLDTEPGTTYVLARSQEVSAPEVRPQAPLSASAALASDLLVLAPSGLSAAAERYSEARSSRGVSARSVNLEWVFQSYSHGFETPDAIRSYLRDLESRDALPSVVLLLGKGTFDHRNYGGQGDSLVVTDFVATPFGLYSADNRIGDLDDDGFRETLVARLPVTTEAEVDAYLAKIEEHVVQREAAVLVADNADVAGDFPTQTSDLAPLVKGRRSVISLEQKDAETVFEELVESWDDEPELFIYTGHGSSTQLADENVFDTADVEALQGTVSLALSLSCAVNRHEVPSFLSLGEALVLEDDAGSLVSVAPSGLSFSQPSFDLGRHLLDRWPRRGSHLGVVLLQSLNAFEAEDTRGLTSLYSVLGDPTAVVSE
ncbi:MAG: C25 family cysteine peptidase [Acidobacteriota bacterium]